jgi:hypothetical protein
MPRLTPLPHPVIDGDVHKKILARHQRVSLRLATTGQETNADRSQSSQMCATLTRGCFLTSVYNRRNKREYAERNTTVEGRHTYLANSQLLRAQFRLHRQRFRRI